MFRGLMRNCFGPQELRRARLKKVWQHQNYQKFQSVVPMPIIMSYLLFPRFVDLLPFHTAKTWDPFSYFSLLHVVRCRVLNVDVTSLGLGMYAFVVGHHLIFLFVCQPVSCLYACLSCIALVCLVSCLYACLVWHRFVFLFVSMSRSLSICLHVLSCIVLPFCLYHCMPLVCVVLCLYVCLSCPGILLYLCLSCLGLCIPVLAYSVFLVCLVSCLRACLVWLILPCVPTWYGRRAVCVQMSSYALLKRIWLT